MLTHEFVKKKKKKKESKNQLPNGLAVKKCKKNENVKKI